MSPYFNIFFSRFDIAHVDCIVVKGNPKYKFNTNFTSTAWETKVVGLDVADSLAVINHLLANTAGNYSVDKDLADIMADTRGNVTQAASVIGINRGTLHKRLNKKQPNQILQVNNLYYTLLGSSNKE